MAEVPTGQLRPGQISERKLKAIVNRGWPRILEHLELHARYAEAWEEYRRTRGIEGGAYE